MPTLLWTDALIYLLIALLATFFRYARHQEPFLRPWRKVRTSTTAMVSLVVLVVYAAIGLLDTLHFRPLGGGTEPISLLDLLLTHLRTRQETTYSAPFATHAYSRAFVLDAAGESIWTYPRLIHGGSHLRDVADRPFDIALHAILGGLFGALLWIGAATLAVRRLARALGVGWQEAAERIRRGQTETPWRAVLITAGLLLVAFGAIYTLSFVYHVLGTDKVGQDVLYQTLKSIRTALVIGTLTTLIMLPFALALGTAAGYFGGWIDDAIQYLYTTLNAIPSVLLIAAAILLQQVYMAQHEAEFASIAARADFRLLFLCMILGLTSWTGLCRLLRAETLKLRELDYVQAARTLGVSHRMVLLRHIVPNVFHIVLITVALDFSGLVLAEAVLSYVNIGVDPTMNSFGNTINRARLELAREPVVWWPLVSTFVFMFALVLSANLYADAVRDAFDPRRNRG